MNTSMHHPACRILPLTCLLLIGLLALVASPAAAQSCITEKAGRNLVCTANDVRIAFADNVRTVSGQPLTSCIDGQTFSFIADFHVVLSATSRFDIGLFFATDGDPNGDGALSGTCSANMITPLTSDTPPLGTAFSSNLDGDTCRDLTTTNGWGAPNGRVVTVRVNNVLCQDSDQDGKLNLPNCTSWSQNSGGVCNTADDTAPGSPSKCSCDAAFNLPVTVDNPQLGASKTVSPASLPEPGGEFTYTIKATNNSQFVSVTLDRICDDKYGLIAKVASAPACAAGTEGTINSTTCALPQTIAVGGSYECTFKASFTSGTAPASLTDTVTFFGHDSNTTPKNVQASASATATVDNVAPDGTVTKSLDSLQCAVVRYKVKLTNNKPNVDTLTLTALVDSGFGDVTTVHDDVVATTCTIPQGGVAVGSTPFECTFDAYFCGGSHTNQITATWADNDGNTTNPKSNSLTIDVGATVAP